MQVVSSTLLLWWIQRNPLKGLRFFFAHLKAMLLVRELTVKPFSTYTLRLF